MASTSSMRNALTVDVEDYFHVAAFARQIDPATWDRFPPRVERNTHRLLELFAAREARATFVVLGGGCERLQFRKSAAIPSALPYS